MLLGAGGKGSPSAEDYIRQGEYEKAISILEDALKKSPSDVKLKQALFLCYFQAGVKKFEGSEFASAGEYFAKALKLDPSSLQARQNLALSLFKLGNLEEAKRVVEEGLKTAKPDRNLLLILAEIYQKEGNGEKVIATLEEIHNNYPEDKETGLILARLYYSQLKLDKARQVYLKLAEHYPQDLEILSSIAKTYEDEGKWGEAISEYEKMLQIDPKNIFIYRRMGRIYEKEGKLDEAIALYNRALESLKNIPQFYLWLGELWEKKGDENSALENFKKARDLSIEHPLPYFKLAMAEKDSREREMLLKQAVNKGVRALEEAESHLLVQIGEETSLESLRGSLELAEEIENIEKTLRLSLDAYLFPEGERSSERAERELQNLLKRYPQSRILLEYTGLILESKGEWDEALEVWRKILQRNPRVERAHLGMGKALEAMGKWEEAGRAYKSALELKEDDEEAFEGMVRMYEKTGKIGVLVEEWERKAKFPSYRYNLLFLNRFEKLLLKAGREKEAEEVKKKIEEVKKIKEEGKL
jgi:tetratricopeptide (TPR) repeat protein